MLVTMRAKKTSWDKTGVQYFCQYGDKKKNKKTTKEQSYAYIF
jgi:hypothetical protein